MDISLTYDICDYRTAPQLRTVAVNFVRNHIMTGIISFKESNEPHESFNDNIPPVKF